MTRLAFYGDAAVGILQRDVRVFLSYRLSLISQLATVMFSLLLFYYISRLVTVGGFSPDAYYAFAVIGILSLEVLSSAMVLLPSTVRAELVAGTFERLVLSPFGAVGSVTSMLVFPFAWAVTKSAIVLILAAILFDLPVQWPEALLALPVAVVGALSFAPFGLIIAGVVLLVKQALSLSSWFVAGISIVAGFYFPIVLLPEWIQWMSDVQPFTPAVELLRHTLVGAEMRESAVVAVVKLVGFAAVLTPISLWFLATVVRASRRSGTIIEY